MPDCLRATVLEVGVWSKGPDVDVVTVNMRLRRALIYEAEIETGLVKREPLNTVRSCTIRDPAL